MLGDGSEGMVAYWDLGESIWSECRKIHLTRFLYDTMVGAKARTQSVFCTNILFASGVEYAEC